MATNGIQKLVVEQAKSIETELEKGKIRTRDRLMLEAIKLILIVLANDHSRTESMWQWFRPTIWLVVVAVIAIVTALATGHIHVSAGISQ